MRVQSAVGLVRKMAPTDSLTRARLATRSGSEPKPGSSTSCGAPIAAHRLEQAKRLAVESVCESIARAGAEGRSVLDLLMYAGGLDEVAAARFAAQGPERLRARGSIAVREVRLSQEDAARLRDLYAQIAAARGG